MPIDFSNLLVVFAAVYVLNTIPAFAPPTWMFLAVVAAVALLGDSALALFGCVADAWPG